MGTRDKDMFLPRKKAHPSHSDPQLGVITKVQIVSLGSEGFELHIRHPNP